MHAHIPTIFIVIVAISFALAAAIAMVSFGRKNGLMPWAFGIAMHGLAYLLFSLRGEISDFLSIVVANTAIATMFAMFTEGIRNFSGRQKRIWLIWAPIPVVAISFSFLLDDLQSRIVLSGAIYALQSTLLAWYAHRSRLITGGRGGYVVATGALLLSLVMLARLAGALVGYHSPASISTSSPIQTLTFLISIISTLLVVIGVLLMTWERDERLIMESEMRMRTLFESTSDAVMLLDERGFFECNPATLKMFGCPSKDVFVTKKPADLSPPRQPDGTDSDTLAQQQIAKAMRESSNRFEWMHQRLDDGSSFPAEVLLNAMDFNGRHVLQAVVRDISERKRMQAELERQAHLDALTGLSNRGHFMQRAEFELARALRYAKPLSLLMMDIDNFKQINDTHGHRAGDEVLRTLAATCRRTLREIDLIGRIGGEEFAVVLPEAGMEQAQEVAERLRRDIAAAGAGLDADTSIGFTVSIGIAGLESGKVTIDSLLSAADQAMYAAKAAGKNCVRHITTTS
jgi:diguanylate cyclase (GGDEF)-like protein/PAS domain S-box-containing protein